MAWDAAGNGEEGAGKEKETGPAGVESSGMNGRRTALKAGHGKTGGRFGPGAETRLARVFIGCIQKRLMPPSKSDRRTFGVHYTPTEIFSQHIFPAIRDRLWDYCWADLFCGEGNLIFPIVESIPAGARSRFFDQHVRMFDIDPHAVAKCIEKAQALGIARPVCEKRIRCQDTLEHYPDLDSEFQPFHITNPPYLYFGYIAKHEETRRHLKYFKGERAGLQDLYQAALAGDVSARTQNMIYIIPANFLFGDSASNLVRDMVLSRYRLRKAIVFEKKIFEQTGTNVLIAFFERKESASPEPQTVHYLKFNSKVHERTIELKKENHWRSGGAYDEYISKSPKNRERFSFYLLMKDVRAAPGKNPLTLIDSSQYDKSDYRRVKASVSDELYARINSNPVWVRTVDTGTEEGLAGFYDVNESFGAEGIVVGSDFTYRTSPIQVFAEPALDQSRAKFLRLWSNGLLQYLREKTDGEFLTTFKYSESSYTRKYLGLKQAKAILQSCPLGLGEKEREKLLRLLAEKRYAEAFALSIPDPERSDAAQIMGRTEKPAARSRTCLQSSLLDAS